MILSTFIILGISLGWLEESAHAKWPPEVQWRQLQTQHFDVRFPMESEKFANAVVPELESAYRVLSQEFHWRVASDIQIIIDPFHDLSNGATSTFPENRIVLRTVPFEAASSIGEYQDWIKTLAVHEMTHLIANDLTRDFFNGMRTVFGTAAKMNVFEPIWLQEGLAVYFETRLTSMGRGRSVFYDQVLRSAYLENVFHSNSVSLGLRMDRLNDGAPVWPTGDVPYFFGYAITAEMARLKGVQALADIQNAHAARVPFIIEDLPMKNFKKGFLGIWNDAVAGIESRAKDEVLALRKRPFSELESVTQIGRMSSGPVFIGEDLWVLGDSYHEGRSLIQLGLKTKKTFSVHRFEKPTGKTLKYSKRSNGLVYSRIDQFQEFSEFSDVYFFDLQSRKEKRLTIGARAIDPDISPNFEVENGKIKNGEIVYVKNSPDGNQTLVTFDGRREEILLQGLEFERFSFPQWNLKTGEIVFSLKLRNGMESIRGIDRLTKKMRVWVEGEKNEVLTTPSWHPSGEKLIFVSSRSGVFNAELVEFGKMRQTVSHLETGLFYPVYYDSRKWGAMVYRASGYDFAWVKEVQSESAFPVLRRDGLPEEAQIETLPIAPEPSRYSFFKELLPRYWYPVFDLQNEGFSVGATTSGRDSRNLHYYEASLAYDSRAPFWTYHLLYDYDGLYPTIEFERTLTNQYIAYLNSSNPQTETIASAKYSISDWQIQFGATLDQSRFQSQRAESGGLRAAFSHAHFTSTPDSIDQEEGDSGHRLELESSGYFVGDEQFAAARGRAEFRLHGFFERDFFHWVADGARATNRNFSAFYFVGGSEASLTRDSKFLLRGYPSGALLGRTIVTTNFEYEFSVMDIFRGFTTQPFFYERAKAKVFVDAGSAEKIGVHSENFKRWPIGLGVQFIQDFKLLFRLPLSFSLGFHQGLSSQDLGESQIQMGLFSRVD